MYFESKGNFWNSFEMGKSLDSQKWHIFKVTVSDSFTNSVTKSLQKKLM